MITNSGVTIQLSSVGINQSSVRENEKHIIRRCFILTKESLNRSHDNFNNPRIVRLRPEKSKESDRKKTTVY